MCRKATDGETVTGDVKLASSNFIQLFDFSVMHNKKYEGFSDPREDGRLHIEEMPKMLHIFPLISTDTGYYECSDRVSSNDELFEHHGLTLRRWYIYVEAKQENRRIFLHWKNAADKFSHLIAIPRSQGGYIDCLVTSCRASVSLIFDGKKLENMSYKPGRGFFVKETDLPRLKFSAMQSRMGECEAKIGNRTDTLYFLLLVLRLTVTEVVTPLFNVTLKFKYVLENDSGIYVCSCKLAENGKTAQVTKNIVVSLERLTDLLMYHMISYV
ncbi:hypothetical protein TTRE_0000371401 [Trichuris trichiura]|uniref:Uncharacterized protein n=1 Tax=Trichuris trichiura TaxID=36087 RepID=A0A077Z4M7_TRITR|nr:hypothetical protein TTRE_0000371401 [Trichuris trichiura]